MARRCDPGHAYGFTLTYIGALWPTYLAAAWPSAALAIGCYTRAWPVIGVGIFFTLGFLGFALPYGLSTAALIGQTFEIEDRIAGYERKARAWRN